jgi:hypothetical protein
MSTPEWDRRAAIALCGAFVLVAATTSTAARVQSAPAVGIVRVDVAPLRASVGDPTATWVEQELPRQLAQALSGRTPNGGTLVVRIDSLALGAMKDGWAWDNIGGVATVGGIALPVRATWRYQANAIDQALVVEGNHARVSALVQALAFWIARDF